MSKTEYKTIDRDEISKHVAANSFGIGDFVPAKDDLDGFDFVGIFMSGPGALPLMYRMKTRQEVNYAIAKLKYHRDQVFGPGPDMSRN